MYDITGGVLTQTKIIKLNCRIPILNTIQFKPNNVFNINSVYSNFDACHQNPMHVIKIHCIMIRIFCKQKITYDIDDDNSDTNYGSDNIKYISMQ